MKLRPVLNGVKLDQHVLLHERQCLEKLLEGLQKGIEMLHRSVPRSSPNRAVAWLEVRI